MNIVLFGASEFSKSIDFYLTRESDYKVVAYTATHDSKGDFTEFNKKPLCPFDEIETKYPPSEFQMFVAVGYVKLNSVRKYFIEKAIEKGYKLISHISPTSIFWNDLNLGQNVFIFEGNIIQPNVVIRDGVILGRGNSIGHDSVIDKYAFLANRCVLCGDCYVGSETFIGSNATISDGVSISEKNLIGAASFIRKNTKANEVYVQESAKKISRESSMFFNW